MDLAKPYFMENEDWYYYDSDTGTYKLTDKAPEEARKSYEEFYSALDSQIEIRER